MTNKINGVDISECPLFDKNTGCYHTFNGECVKDSCALYKWLLEHRRLQEENEKLKQVRKNYLDIQEPYIHLYRQIKKQCHKLEEENKSLQMLSCANCGEKYLSPDGAELYEKNVQLQKENEKLKKKIESYNCNADCYKYKEADKYKQALEEIRKYCEEQNLKADYTACEVLTIIDEALNEN